VRKLLLAATALLAFSAVPANAYVVDIIAAIDRASPFFQPAGALPLTNLFGAGIDTHINNLGDNGHIIYHALDGIGAQSGLFSGNLGTLQASPFGNFNSDRLYLSAGGGGGSVNVLFKFGGLTTIDMLWGTVDSGEFRNRIQTSAGDVITGDTILAACALQGVSCVDGQTNVWLRISGLERFNTAVFSDRDANSFEFAVAAVPEPSTWAMMLLGFAGIGFMTYRRRQALLAV